MFLIYRAITVKRKWLYAIIAMVLCVFITIFIVRLQRLSNQEIVFVSTRGNGGLGLYTMMSDGKYQTRISDPEEPQSQLWFRIKWNLPKSLYPFLPSHIYNTSPVWSPNGKKIAYSAIPQEGENEELYIMDAKWLIKKRLTYDDWYDGFPVWSPDSSKIAYTGGNQLCVIELSTNKTDCITPSDIYPPTWSPDSKKLAYILKNELYVVDLDERKPKPISQAIKDPKWSPVSNTIIYVCSMESNFQICSVNADGTRFAQLTTNSDDLLSNNPIWSPNGQKIAFEGLFYSQKNFEIFLW